MFKPPYVSTFVGVVAMASRKRLNALARQLLPLPTADGPDLPGMLGNPSLTQNEDPRLDPRRVAYNISRGRGGPAGSNPLLALAGGKALKDMSTEEKVKLCQTLEAAQDAEPPPKPLPALILNAVEREEIRFKSDEGHEIEMMLIRPKNSKNQGPLPCLYHTHGGGMAFMSMKDALFQDWYSVLASRLGVLIVGVEFRNSGGGKVYGPNAPAAPYPAGLNDCYAGLKYLNAHKKELGVGRTVVATGESGGGNLCCALALLAKRRNELHLLQGVYSFCPYISGTYEPKPKNLSSMWENDFDGAFSWLGQAMADIYTPNAKDLKDPCAWPLEASEEDLKGLPPHMIAVNELDTLRSEGEQYAQKLARAGVDVTARILLQTGHAGEYNYNVAPNVSLAQARDLVGFAKSLGPTET